MSYRTGYGFQSFGMAFRPTPMVKRLLVANVAVFAVTLLAPWFVFEWFSFQPTRIALRPWGPLTYMFLHGSLGHLFFNMLMLFFFGPPLEARWGEREFLKFYAICGLGGVALSYVFLPASIVGASVAWRGRHTWNTVPPLGGHSRSILPRMKSTRDRTIARPSPQPGRTFSPWSM